MKIRKWKKAFVWILTVSIMMQSIQSTLVYGMVKGTQVAISKEIGEQNTAIFPEYEKENTQENSTNEIGTKEQEEVSENEIGIKEQEKTSENETITEEQEKTKTLDISAIYQDGKIRIYHLKQLKAIGTNEPVRMTDNVEADFGTGEPVTVNGLDIVYSLDADYQLMNDIPLDTKQIWTLPEGFTGTFSGDKVEEEAPLYDEKTDTIYVYHNYQLLTLTSKKSETEPVMSKDTVPETFGMGNFLYPDGTEDGQNYLTYDKSHRYVLSKDFTEKMPSMLANKASNDMVLAEDEQLDGRDYPGQVYKEITEIKEDGTEETKKYILIGNELQLRAIGTNKHVTPRVYTTIRLLGIPLGTVPYYPGDADFGLTKDYEGESYSYYDDKNSSRNELMNADFGADGLLDGIIKLLELIFGALAGASLCGTDEAGRPDTSKGQVQLELEYKDLLYSSDANYIIFRNIDLSSDVTTVDGNGDGKENDWIPLLLSGNMEGRLQMEEGNPIKISNIHVTQQGELDPTTTRGLGFFGSISSKTITDGKESGRSAGTTVVKNISLDQVSIENQSTIVADVDETLISGLLKVVGGLLGGLLGFADDILGDLTGLINELLGLDINIGGLEDLGDVLEAILTVQKESDDIFATGSFAGRVVGDVSIENCHVSNATVSNVMGMTGGFVGYTEGTEEYDLLSMGLGGVSNILANVLNILPGIGLGDLITVLLENGLSVDKLIPIGYKKANFINCSVQLKDGTIGNENQAYSGGFVGVQIATEMDTCMVGGLQSVTAKTGAGGFAGIERDDIVHGLLTDNIGVTLYDFNTKSIQSNCVATNQGVTVVKGVQSVDETVMASDSIVVKAIGSYAGGFNGAMTNSVSQSCCIVNIQLVSAMNYAGGFSGIATIGYETSLGEQEEKTLLGALTDIIINLLTNKEIEDMTEEEQKYANLLLNLAGLEPSELFECQVEGKDLQVAVTNEFAGGFIGKGEGIKITPKPEEEQQSGKKNSVKNLSSVTAKQYAGGLVGSIGTANIIGLLNQTVGIGGYLPFEMNETDIQGVEQGYSVIAEEKYAGGIAGLAVGGTVDSITAENLRSVSAGNYAGGFAGRAGTADLTNVGGLNLLGLIKIDNLLSLAEGVAIEITNVEVIGIDGANSGNSNDEETIKNGYTVSSTGQVSAMDTEAVMAGGFISEVAGSTITNSHVRNLQMVKAITSDEKETYAGGFIGGSHTGGLVGLAQEDEDGKLTLPAILDINTLLDVIPYLLPEYNNCTTSFTSNNGNPQMIAQTAGGFVGEMESGVVDNSVRGETDAYAVYGLERVQGVDYAGGFGGKVHAGGVASSDGLKLLGGVLDIDLSLDQLLGVLNVYVPSINSAGVSSAKDGFTVEAAAKDSSAGGYIGYGSGVQIKNSDVTSLKHTIVTPPADGLESANADNYFDQGQSTYAVRGGRYAGGYIGCLDIDSAASIGGGIDLLGNLLDLTNVLGALDVVVSTVENSDVSGVVGGFSVLADGENINDEQIGQAGGYAGKISGGHIKNCDVKNFNYIIGQEMAGGYVGLLEPGDVASVLDEGSVTGIEGLLEAQGNLLTLVQAFVPNIKNSQTRAVPCGGVVRAEGFSIGMTRGIAGGYVGYNHGGQITGKVSDIEGAEKECAVYRLRSVYGKEFAGGFTGLMETADVGSTGNLKVLFGILSTDNLLGLLNAVYPTEKNTAVYGPLRGLDMDTWNAWVEYIGKNGVYGEDLPMTSVSSEEELKERINIYAYGYTVKAGRNEAGSSRMEAGIAGGYVGEMYSGVVTNAHAYDVKQVISYKSAGGFAGEMVTGGVAQVGKVSLLGLNLTGTLNAVQTFVPVIKNSSVTGYQSGIRIRATGISQTEQSETIKKVGYAGGYVGYMVGGQIWGNEQERCFVHKLRRVDGTNWVGGYAGKIDPGSAVALDSASSEGLLGGLLQHLIGTPDDLLSLLNATLSTITSADVKAWNEWGIIVNGAYFDGTANTRYAKAVGGFAGEINGAVIGTLDDNTKVSQVENLRAVIGGEYAGGFFGLADVSAVAEVSNENKTSILESLLTLGSLDVLDAFRTYIYDSSVIGAKEAGLTVSANEGKKLEYENNPVFTGNAGGFGGTLLNGSVKRSSVNNLRMVEGLNNTGGFIGHLGKSGLVDLDSLNLLDQLLGASVGVLDVFGSHVEDCVVDGMKEGFTVSSQNEEIKANRSEIAGGFAGFADLAKLDGNEVKNLKQVYSGKTAGGFAGETSFAYLAKVNANSGLVELLFQVVAGVLELLYLGELQSGKPIHIGLLIIYVEILGDGDVLELNVLGLKIKISLDKETSEEYDLVSVEIGDSNIKLKCDKNTGELIGEAKDEITISLIKANRTRIAGCSVSGIDIGYDVYGSGAGNDENGKNEDGYSGGFVGYNNEGLLKNNKMIRADVIRGEKERTGAFTGSSSLTSNWSFNQLNDMEGENNTYQIYRDLDPNYKQLVAWNGTLLSSQLTTDSTWNIYTVNHLTGVYDGTNTGSFNAFTIWKNAYMKDASRRKSVNVYQEDGQMAVLMKNTPTEPTELEEGEEPEDMQDPCKDKVNLKIKKVWKGDRQEERPEEITLHITRTYKDSNGAVIEDLDFKEMITLTKEDYSLKNVWEKTISSDTFTAYKVIGDKKYYYTYWVSEEALSGYTTEITYSGEHQYSIMVTNTYARQSLLPDTGGSGTRFLYATGILLFGIFVYMTDKKRKNSFDKIDIKNKGG